MAGKTTKNYYQQMLDFIKEEGFCILPSNLIELLLKENTQNFELIHTLQENLVTTVNNLNATLNELNDTFHENNLIIDQRLDNIFASIKNNNITTQQHLTNGNQTNSVSHTKENINEQLLNRRWLHYQILRSQDLQECYNHLISQESPDVPAKFRVKINSNTPAYETPLQCNAAVDNLKREIRLLEERQKQRKTESKTMEEQIKLTINWLDLTAAERDNFYVNEIQKGEDRNVREWQKHLDQLVNAFNQEQNDTNIHNLLQIVGSDSKAQHHSKNNFFNYKNPCREYHQR